jgi:hypothetical protein
MVANVTAAPQHVIFRDKDPRGCASFLAMTGDFSPTVCAHLLRKAPTQRQPVSELKNKIEAPGRPVLVMVGDQSSRGPWAVQEQCGKPPAPSSSQPRICQATSQEPP